MRQAFAVSDVSHAALRPLNYTPEVERFRSTAGKRAVRLGSMLQTMGPAYGAVFTRLDCDPAHGVELITQGDMFAAEPSGRVIRMDSMARPERHRVRPWQVLIAGAGTLGENELYGRSIIADARLADRFVGPHAMVLSFEDEGGLLNLYTYAFLCTRIGIRAVRSTSFGTKILGLRKDMLADLPVPVPEDGVLKRVAILVRTAVEQRELYALSLAAARRVVEELPAMQEAHEMCADRRARCLAWAADLSTLCAWNYASTGSALAYLRSRWQGRLADVIGPSGIFRGNRFARVPCEPPHGVELVSQRDVFLTRPVPQRIRISEQERERLSVPVGTLLAGGQGTLGEGEIFGRVALVTKPLQGKVISEHLLRIQPEARARAAVFAYLSTLVGLRLMRSAAVGTKLLSLRPDLLFALPLPDLDATRTRRITGHVKAAVDAHAAAESAEADAIRIVEEEVLPQWLG